MRRHLFFTILLLLFTLPGPALHAQALGQNLIVNPGAEDSAANNKIPNWTEVSGFEWQRQSGVSGSFPTPLEGSYLFFAGQTASAELRQDVTLSAFSPAIDAGAQYFVFTGYVRSFNQSPPDSARIILEYRADTVAAPLRVFDSQNIGNVSNWQQVKDSAAAPKGARLVRIRLISTRFAGSDNDGYFDNLSLVAVSPVFTSLHAGAAMPDGFKLYQNYPNPFNPSTVIGFTLPAESAVSVRVYNTLGRVVAEPDHSVRAAGYHETRFDAGALPGGVYYYSVTAKPLAGGKEYHGIMKMLYVK